MSTEIEELKAQLIAQQDNLEKMFTNIVEQMHEALIKNKMILDGKLSELDALSEIQIAAVEEVEDVFYAGQTLLVDGIELTVASIGKENLHCKSVVRTSDGTRVQDVQISRDMALKALDEAQALQDAADEAAQIEAAQEVA